MYAEIYCLYICIYIQTHLPYPYSKIHCQNHENAHDPEVTHNKNLKMSISFYNASQIRCNKEIVRSSILDYTL